LEVALDIREYLKNKFENKSCHVLGFARSNKPLIDILLSIGADVTVRDKKEEIVKDPDAVRLAEQGAKFVLGEEYLQGIGGDYIFRTPGIRHDLPGIVDAIEKGALLTSEMELFFEICPCKVLGITGSDGKTTTTTLTHLFLHREFEKRGVGKAYVGGNIGAPLLPLVFEMTEDDIAVVELSSFQLQTMKQSPKRAIITNISPNHLNWHTDMDEYVEAKRNICNHSGIEHLVVNSENAITFETAQGIDLPISYFSSKRTSYEEIVPRDKKDCTAIYVKDEAIVVDDGISAEKVIDVSDILIPGLHNVENYMAAIAITRGFVSRETVREVATTFPGVEHRLELVREKNGVKFYNSSIDSSPTRTAAALSALPKAPIIILGGEDKNIPFDGLALDVCRRVKAAVVTGKAAQKILDTIGNCPEFDRNRVCIKHVDDFREAVLVATEMAESGDIVLLSPACTSFDRFNDFAERGNFFKSIVNVL
jgi:UDP-N-acetylmuramoylalanine--D-glutamate ligase